MTSFNGVSHLQPLLLQFISLRPLRIQYGSFHHLSRAQFASPARWLAHAAEMSRISSHGLPLNVGAMGRKQNKSMARDGIFVEECHAKAISSFDFGIIKNYSIAQILMVESARSRRPDQ